LTPWILSQEVAPRATITYTSRVTDISIITYHQEHVSMTLLAQAFSYKNYIVVIVVNADNSDAVFEVTLQVKILLFFICSLFSLSFLKLNENE
jgi:hypothetical protein